MKALPPLAAIAALLAMTPALADPHPSGLSEHRFNGPVAPVTSNGVTTLRIEDRKCSTVDYGDGRGESDCYNGNVRSTLMHQPEARLGEAVEYRFDIRVDPSIDYAGFHNSHSAGFIPDQIDSRLRIASWEGPFLHNFLYMLKLDKGRGIRFLSKPCVARERLGEWNSFSMKVRWASDSSGWIRVACNGETVHLAEGIATNQAPECYVTNQCEPGKKKNPNRFLFILGPVMSGFGHEWQKYGKASQFTDIQKEGITIEVRNFAVTKGAKLQTGDDIETVRQLQAHLASLGCDPGPADGIAGRKTRETALACREFPEGVRPEKLDLSTAAAMLAAYRQHHPVE